ncbi:AlbA family DNA-binding domain-containing protein [Streptomyces parvus]|uniref:AlbA family DNA-binding domain-containing protein n=1 Tax=Streptomyces parvus TaxID=66428 RepID=UPI0035DE8CE7
MLYRSRRLESLFGSPLGSVSYAELAALVGNPEAAEAEDLDYKRELTADDDKKKEEFAKDLAAFANHIGGVLIVGMAEVRGVPSKVMDTDVSDQLRRHLQQVVAANTAPPVRFDMRAVPNPRPEAGGRGLLLIAVPRSPHGPHAVTAPPTMPTQKALRYPRRAASKTDWLSETDVATAYQRRFAAGADRSARLDTVECELLSALPLNGHPHLIVALTPEISGEMVMNSESFGRYRTELQGVSLLIQEEDAFTTIRVGSRRLIATDGHPDGTSHSLCELHRDGSGTFAQRVPLRTRGVGSERVSWLPPDLVVWLLMSALNILALHARDRAGATGTALIRAALVQSSPRHPVDPPLQAIPFPLIIDHGAEEVPLSTQSCTYADGEAVALLDDLAIEGPALVQATSRLADEIVQAFGIAEASPITPAGELRQAGWGTPLRNAMTKWARAHGINVVSA